MTLKKMSSAVLAASLLSSLCLNAQADTFKVCAKDNEQKLGTLMGVKVYKSDPGSCPAFTLDNIDILWPDETGTFKFKGLEKTKSVYACVYIQPILWQFFKKVKLNDKDTVILNSKVEEGHLSYSLAINPNSCRGKH